MTVFNIITLAGGLAMFLYGMNTMGAGLEKIAGRKTESILKKLTSSTLKGVMLGAIITALIQSSSGTTVIVIGLVNSGIMKLAQAVGVVMGANIGTTVTAQILRLADISSSNLFLQLLKPTSLGPAVAFVGAILYVFFKSTRKRNVGQTMLGFGVLFFGMATMENALLPLRDSVWFEQFFTGLQNPFLGLLAGTILTAVIQSSSASVGILQALSATGMVTWSSAIPIILGQNIGTTSTGLLASIGASRAAKRVAIVHLYFNIIGTALFMAGIYAFQAIVGIPFWHDVMSRGDIANFHTVFNVVVTLVFIPFNKLLVRLAEWTVRDKKDDVHDELNITVLDERLYQSPAMAIQQAYTAVEQMAHNAALNQRDAIPLLFDHNLKKIELVNQREDVIDKLDVSVSNYLVKMNDLDLSDTESHDVTLLINFVTEFERMGDYAINVAERSGEVFDKQIVFSESARRELYVLNDAVTEIMQTTVKAFSDRDLQLATHVEPLEETVDLICETLRERHISRLKAGTCNIDAGIVFLEVLTDFERISDHCSNVAARMIASAQQAEHFNTHELRRVMHAGQREDYNRLLKEYTDKYYPQLSAEGDSLPEQTAFEIPAG